MLNIIMYILLSIGLIYFNFVLGKWHRLAKKYDVVAGDLIKEVNREAGFIASNVSISD